MTRTTPAPLTLVLAATGKTGRRVAERLEAQGLPVRRGSRSSEIPFDWNDETTWAPALDGVQAVYLVYTPDLAVPSAPAAITRFVELAKAANVQRIVVLSGRGEVEAQCCEEIVLQSGIPSTVVRASWFAQNFDEGIFHEMVMGGTVALPAGPIGEPFIDVDDIADVATVALTEDGHAGEIYEVTGPRLLTFTDAVREIAEASGREVEYVQIPVEAFEAGLKEAGLDDEYRAFLVYLFTTVLDGRSERTTDGVERALGRPARDFGDYVRAAAKRGAWSDAEVSA